MTRTLDRPVRAEQVPRVIDYSQQVPVADEFHRGRVNYIPSSGIFYGQGSYIPSTKPLPLQDIRFSLYTNSVSDELVFRFLADDWQRQTGHYSIVQQKVLHPAYQEIIGMGNRALPFLIKELDSKPSHWFWALRAIARENPAQHSDTPEEAAIAWREWWINKQGDIWRTGFLLIEKADFQI